MQISLKSTKTISLNEFLRKNLPNMLNLQSNEVCPSFSSNEVCPCFSNSKIRRLIVSGAVSVNGRIVTRPGFELRGSSLVVVDFDEKKFFYEKQPNDVKFEVTDDTVLFEDDNLIFIDKPANFPMEQTITGNRANLHDAVVDYLWKRNPQLRNPPYVGIMHRLDRTTSGVVMFTKTRAVNKAVSEIFQSHNLVKKYFAVVEDLSSDMGFTYKTGDVFTVEMFMGRITGKTQQGKWGELSEADGGQFSKTEFKFLKQTKIEGKRCFLLECNLFTGRTHQIRVHLASRGLCIMGDELYGGNHAKRLYLHSALLSFEMNGTKYEVKSLLKNV